MDKESNGADDNQSDRTDTDDGLEFALTWFFGDFKDSFTLDPESLESTGAFLEAFPDHSGFFSLFACGVVAHCTNSIPSSRSISCR